jgi:hypothetical protein
MTAYAMQGTPTLVVVDRAGRRRLQHFGQVDDLALGSLIGTLLAESADGPDACTDAGCPAPA